MRNVDCNMLYSTLCCLVHHPTHNAHTIIITIITNPKKKRQENPVQWPLFYHLCSFSFVFYPSTYYPIASHSFLWKKGNSLGSPFSLERFATFNALSLCDTNDPFSIRSEKKKCKWKHFVFEFIMCFTRKKILI